MVFIRVASTPVSFIDSFCGGLEVLVAWELRVASHQ